MTTLEEFTKQYCFCPELALHIGLESEFMFMRDGNAVPLAPGLYPVLKRVKPLNMGYELSACQGETRTRPCLIGDLSKELADQEEILRRVGDGHSFERLYAGLGPEDMPLEVYPNERYLQKSKVMSREVLQFACRAMAVQFNIGMPDHETAVLVHDALVDSLEELCDMGDLGSGRLEQYKKYVEHWQPMQYESVEGHYEVAQSRGFAENRKDDWGLFRISNGTIEFRMPDSTSDIEIICELANFYRKKCEEVMPRKLMAVAS